MKPHVRFSLAAALAALAVVALLLWLGPVWVYDLEDQALLLVGVPLGLVVLLSLVSPEAAADVAGAAAELAGGAAQAGAKAGELGVRRIFRSGFAAAAGLLVGTGIGLLFGLALSHSEPARLAYARARPERALAEDFVLASRAIDRHREERGRPPEDTAALARALRSGGAPLPCWSRLEGDAWLDPWGRPLVYGLEKRLGGLAGSKVALRSVGPDGIDDRGRGDDIALTPSLVRSGRLRDLFAKALASGEQ